MKKPEWGDTLDAPLYHKRATAGGEQKGALATSRVTLAIQVVGVRFFFVQ
ncbi:MAG: hypothetical protein JW809_16105 [Pirellulales bacterium]|nr:hypothetical protein [Pirellulales bacterium]